MKNWLIVILLMSTVSKGYAQNPAHFILGENELDGVHIYSMHQDRSLNYWFATDNGIFKYDGYEFKNIPCSEMLSSSLFNIVSDPKDVIYCHNLSGQIFKIEQDRCELYFEIPDSLVSSVMEIKISKTGRFFISSTHLAEIMPDKTLKFHVSSDLKWVQFYEEPNGTLVGIGFNGAQKMSGLRILPEHSEIFPFKIIQKNDNLISKFNTFQYLNVSYLFDSFTGRNYKISNDSLIHISSFDENNPVLSVYSTPNQLWMPNPTLGLSSCEDIYNPLSISKQYFLNYKISDYLVDNEGNILFGTFKDGIIVLPKSQISTLNVGDLEGKINLICLGFNDEILLGTNDGLIGILTLNNKIDFASGYPSNSIEFLEKLVHHNQFLVGGILNALITDKKIKSFPSLLGSIKDLYVLPNNQYALATNVGALIINLEGKVDNPFKKDLNNHSDLYFEKLYDGRCYSVAFDSIDQSLYLGTSLGLKRISKDGTEDLSLNGTSVLCRDMEVYSNRVYVATDKNGILIYENGDLVDHWTTNNYLISNNTRQLISNSKYIIVNTDHGVQILSEDGITKSHLTKSDGLISNHAIDIAANDEFLWILNQKGLQRVKLDDTENSFFKPNVRINTIKINGTAIENPREIGNFNYDQNRFEVNFSSMSLRYKDEITYQYRLIGVEDLWQESNYLNHNVDYKTLPPGDYVFEVKAIWRGIPSETIKYKFTIQSPFWTKWWFYSLIFVLVLVIFYLFFNRQMREQQRKSKLHEELYESKLTAIQAQMNPHFIFNSLNSIQDLVLKNDAENAYNYISKFALLVRNTLTNSDKDFIDFSDEINSLRLYLDLEKLRFKDAFDYKITAPTDAEIQIPPMLIQPFIENSLIHGLLHKSGHKIIEVSFEINEVITCTIIDNGIGRKEAKLIQERQFRNHESFAISAIKRRLSILEMRFGENYNVEYIDLESNSESCGTKVIIKIPYIKHY